MTESADSPSVLELIDAITIISLLFVLLLLFAAYAFSQYALPSKSTTTIRVLFVWHLFDALVHLIMEASFLYHSFFSQSPDGAHFGAIYSTAPTGLLWQEYSKADSRWGIADPIVVAIELPTVLLEGPGALYICYLLASKSSSAWFWIIVVAIGELYGGWMTFAPEWLTGSSALNTSNFLYLWVYLFLFNTIWVWIPLWCCWVSYREIANGLAVKNKAGEEKKGL